MRLLPFFLLAVGLCHPFSVRADELPEGSHQQIQFVRSRVLPLLQARCFQCHQDAADHRGGLLLTSRKAMLRGGDSGPAIVPGKPEESLLVEAIRYESFEMPPRSRMPQAEIDILVRWISEGAPWPKELDVAPAPESSAFPLQQRRASHWAWQPIQEPPVPEAGDWGRVPLDGFVLDRLRKSGLKPAPDADRYTLIRRLYFDLIGIPPTVQQINDFVHNPQNDDAAVETVVDQLLMSPHFGERWGRHWLDLVRYAETLGHEFDYPLHHAWRYRDYVIRAFNEDIGYDQLLLEHVAGDLLPNPRRHPVQQFNESVIGTGFWFLHEDKHAPVDVRAEEAAKIDNQIDVFSKTFLGLTVACARCHDHKFDAISTYDYYALAGFLQSSRRHTAWLDPEQKIAKKLPALQQARRETLAALLPPLQQPEQTTAYLQAALAAVATDAASSDESPVGKANGPASERAGGAAAQQGLLPDALEAWGAALRDSSSKHPDHVLSLPATLAQSEDPSDELRRWVDRVREASRSAKTTLFANFQRGLPNGWFTQGHAFATDVPDRAGVSVDDGRLHVAGNSGVNSARLSHKLRGALTSPTFELGASEILVRVAGRGARMRLIIDGYRMFEFNGLLFGGVQQKIDTDGEFHWLRFAGDTHRYRGHRMYIEFLDDGDGWFDVQEVRFAEAAGVPPPEATVSPFNLQLAEDIDVSASREQTLQVWARRAHQQQLLATALLVGRRASSGVAAYQHPATESWLQVAADVAVPVPVIAITDGTPEDEVVFIRGNHRNPGEIAHRQILTALKTTTGVPRFEGSGRRELAEQMIAPENPLVARVAVNRIWHHLFGRGIVESTDNFGVLGKRPTHPRLLDHLATQFRRNGWSFKQMIKMIALSRTYRQSSQRSPAGEATDPNNLLLHRANIRRLQGEAVRDAILAVSGRLDPKRFGPPVPIRLNSFLQGRGRPRTNGPVDGEGRRSIYLSVYRNFLNPFMQAFDVPAPVSTTGRRTVSNVPAQALILLNNEFVAQQAKLWAARLTQRGDSQTAHALNSLAWFQLLGRPASDDELQPLLEFAGGKDAEISQETMSDICHVLLNSKEFLFLK